MIPNPDQRTYISDPEAPSKHERAEFFVPEEPERPSKEEVSPLVEVFRTQLIALLEEAALGRTGLFTTNAANPDEAWHQADQLRTLAFALQQILSQDETRSALVDEFLDLCSIHGEANPGERRLARIFLDRIEKDHVGTPTEAPPPWLLKEQQNQMANSKQSENK